MAEKIYSIGDVICWKVGNIPAKGIVRDDEGGGTVDVRCFEVNGRSANMQIKVKRECITIE